jgi:hypothetical protein
VFLMCVGISDDIIDQRIAHFCYRLAKGFFLCGLGIEVVLLCGIVPIVVLPPLVGITATAIIATVCATLAFAFGVFKLPKRHSMRSK